MKKDNHNNFNLQAIGKGAICEKEYAVHVPKKK